MIFDTFKKTIKYFLLQKKFPRSKIYYGAFLDTNSFIGKNTVLFRDVYLQNTKIDDYSYVQSNSMIINTNISKFCSIASDVKIGLPEHPLHMVCTSPVFYDNTQPLPCFFINKNIFEFDEKTTIVDSDVWIGYGAIIKSGVTIGVGAVVGAGAVVTKDIEPYSVVAGVSAKHIKYRFDKVTREKLLSSKWWEFDEKKLEKLASYFNTPEIFLEKLKEFNEI